MSSLSTVFIDIPPVNQYRPPHVGGDREFKGHGPDVRVSAHLEIEDAMRIISTVEMSATETQSDWTTFQGTARRQTVFDCAQTHPGWRIRRIVGSSASTLAFRDHDHAVNRHGPTTGNLVQLFEVMGDSRGSDEPWVSVTYNRVSVELIRD